MTRKDEMERMRRARTWQWRFLFVVGVIAPAALASLAHVVVENARQPCAEVRK